MQLGRPSRTARVAAAHRAAHQILERGRIFADPLALPILGEDVEAVVREAEADPSRRRLRLFIAVRARFAEDALASAVTRGVRQVVVLGAGLDTFAYRNPFGDRLRIFEVDHPATQAWKLQRLADAAIQLPDSLTYTPVDFDQGTLPEGLLAVAFDPTQQTFFTWLGVVPYLAEEAVWATLAFITSLPNGAHVVFDYSDPPDSLPPEARILHDRRAAHVEALGESFVTHFEPARLQARLIELGFSEVEDLGPPQISARYFPNRGGALPNKGGHILRAATV